MRWVVFLFGSGWAAFLGTALILLSVALAATASWNRPRLLLVIVGGLLVGLSATPWPNVLYLALALATIGWLIAERRWPKQSPWWRSAVVIAWLSATGWELTYQWPPERVETATGIAIFGDSVTAGTDDSQTATWPKLLAREQHLKIRDFSRVGARTATAVQFARNNRLTNEVVVLEIGGNDLLGETSPDQFEQDLETLLKLVAADGRRVLMFELPLFPAANRFGQIQRRLAARHGVRLIPKWKFLRVLTADGATEDGIHLTQSGHELMARMVQELVRVR